jgi:hypothetical protein
MSTLWPHHVPFRLWQSWASYPRAQTLPTVEGGLMGDHLPLEVVVREPIAHLKLHRQQGGCRGVRAAYRGVADAMAAGAIAQ